MTRASKLRQTQLPEILIFLTGLFLYTYQINTESLWIDEILSVESAQGPLNLNRPLYFILLRFWMRFGQSDLWLRIPSVLFGLACIMLTYTLGRQLANRTVGLVSALLLSLSPLAIYHSQEVRFYMMSTFLGLAGSWCLSKVLQLKIRQTKIRQWQKSSPSSIFFLGWIALRCLGFLTAQPNLLLLFPDLMLITWKVLPSFKRPEKLRLNHWLPGLVLLLVPTCIILSDVIPELIEFLSYTTHISTATPGIHNLIGKISALTVWPLRGPNHPWLIDTFYQPLFQCYSVLMVLLIAMSSMSCWNPNTPRNQVQTHSLLPAVLWGLFPILSIFILAQGFPILWQDRYALVSAPYVLILLAAAWRTLWSRKKTIAISVAIVYILAVSGPLVRYYTLDYHADWRGLSEALSQRVQPNDLVLIYPGSFLEIINYYYDGDDGEATLLPMDEVIAPEDLEAEAAISLIQTANRPTSPPSPHPNDPPKGKLWVLCPIVDQWNSVKNELTERLTEEGFELRKKDENFLDQWHWGPALYLFSSS